MISLMRLVAVGMVTAASFAVAVAVASGPTPSLPFPQHAPLSAGAVLPSIPRAEMDAAVARFYDVWKARYFHAGCSPGQAYIFCNREKTSPDKEAISVSEGHGYGMILSVYAAGHDPEAKADFDALFRFFKAHQSKLTPGLMAWMQIAGCRERKGDADSASDGDLDIAYSLLLADRQWGSAGKINYESEAVGVLKAIAAADINTQYALVKLGDWVARDSKQERDTRLSDFMPGHFRAFARATEDAVWQSIIEEGYDRIGALQHRFAPETGLLPDFATCSASGALVPPSKKLLETKHDGSYFYNACRCPWRLGLDFLSSGDPRAKAALQRMNTFIIKKTRGNPEEIVVGYRLDGGAIEEGDHSLAFTAPFMVAAMCSSETQGWLDHLWESVAATAITDDDYYGNTIKLLCMFASSGNWWEP